MALDRDTLMWLLDKLSEDIAYYDEKSEKAADDWDDELSDSYSIKSTALTTLAEEINAEITETYSE